MKKVLILILTAGVALAAARAATLKDLPADKFRAAGLHKLTEAELAELQTVFELLKTGEISAIKQEAEQKVAAAETRVKETEAKVKQAEVEQKKAGPGWLGALITLKRAEAKTKVEVSDMLVARLQGTFRTFSGRRSFTLENGQVWTMMDNESYAGPTYTEPSVEIYPGIMGSFWLRIPEAAVRFKVKPVKLD